MTSTRRAVAMRNFDCPGGLRSTARAAWRRPRTRNHATSIRDTEVGTHAVDAAARRRRCSRSSNPQMTGSAAIASSLRAGGRGSSPITVRRKPGGRDIGWGCREQFQQMPAIGPHAVNVAGASKLAPLVGDHGRSPSGTCPRDPAGSRSAVHPRVAYDWAGLRSGLLSQTPGRRRSISGTAALPAAESLACRRFPRRWRARRRRTFRVLRGRGGRAGAPSLLWRPSTRRDFAAIAAITRRSSPPIAATGSTVPAERPGADGRS